MAHAGLAHRLRPEEQTRERILAAAAEQFADVGYAATSIRDIAREVGVTVGAIYVHFASKDRLLVAVYEEGVARMSRAVDAALADGGGAWEQLAAAACAHVESLLGNAGFARVIVRVSPTDVAEAARDLRRLRDGYEERFRRLFAALDLVPRADRTLLRLMLLAALNATQTWFKRGASRVDAATIARFYVDTLRHGAAKTRSAS